MARGSVLVALCFLFIFKTTTTNESFDLHDVVAKLSTKISELQTKRDTVEFPPLSWKHYKGVYDSKVKLNFHGSPEMAIFRDAFEIFDNNMFATAWVTSCLMEAHLYGTGLKANGGDLQLAVEAINQFRDRNSNNDTSLRTFWPQTLNKSSGVWESMPENLLALFSLTDYMPAKTVESLLRMLGLSGIADVMEHLLSEKEMFSAAFRIPPDFDDTFVNIGLGSLLSESRSDFPNQYKTWTSANTNLSSAFNTLKKYAYRPRSGSSGVDTIDTRTYYYMHEYIYSDKPSKLSSEPAYVTTWAQNSKEAVQMNDKGVVMPFFVNNVDVTVAANTIYGITASLLSGLVDATSFDADVQTIYEHSGDLIAYELSHNFSSRRDLALTYYPSKFECYWFNSRTLAVMRRHSQTSTQNFKVMGDLQDKLEEVFENYVTMDILATAQNDSQGNVYFDDFLGNGDFDENNKAINRAEDRLFTTSMALNTLLNVHTEYDANTRKNKWRTDTSAAVKSTITGSVKFLAENILSRKYKPWNAFFSGSGKSLDSMPFWYPANRIEYLNGTEYTGETLPPPGTLFLMGLKGTVTKETYTNMTAARHFGKPTPTDFSGYNPRSSPEGFFPFWSSDSYTYATTALALSKYLNM